MNSTTDRYGLSASQYFELLLTFLLGVLALAAFKGCPF